MARKLILLTSLAAILAALGWWGNSILNGVDSSSLAEARGQRVSELGLPEIEIADQPTASSVSSLNWTVIVLPDLTAVGYRTGPLAEIEYISRKVGETKWTHRGEGAAVLAALKAEAYANPFVWSGRASASAAGLAALGILGCLAYTFSLGYLEEMDKQAPAKPKELEKPEDPETVSIAEAVEDLRTSKKESDATAGQVAEEAKELAARVVVHGEQAQQSEEHIDDGQAKKSP